MKKKLRKNTQLSFINTKGAGRPRIHDPGIRHTERPLLKKESSLHITIKINRNKADLKNKKVLKLLKRAILNARKKGLKIIHYSLEYDHVHLLIEAQNNKVLGLGMQSFGVTLSRGVNRLKKLKGVVYEHRYHFRQISSYRELKNVLNYIFNNGIKHKSAKTIDNIYNSLRAEIKYYLFTRNITPDMELISLLDRGRVFYHGLDYL